MSNAAQKIMDQIELTCSITDSDGEEYLDVGISAWDQLRRAIDIDESRVQSLEAALRDVTDYKAKVRALCEGLECQNIDYLLDEGQVGDYRRLGERMADITKSIIDSEEVACRSVLYADTHIMPWLSAALEDPYTCEEFKQVIRDWMDLNQRATFKRATTNG